MEYKEKKQTNKTNENTLAYKPRPSHVTEATLYAHYPKASSTKEKRFTTFQTGPV